MEPFTAKLNELLTQLFEVFSCIAAGLIIKKLTTTTQKTDSKLVLATNVRFKFQFQWQKLLFTHPFCL